MKLNVKAFALAGGIAFGLAVFLLTIWYLIFGFEGHTLQKLHHVYLGYSVSFPGALIGLVWGFVDGFIGGAIFSWLYNRFLPKKNT
jgi:NhaP-type Na+/H+ or K+/H+ antiporter